MGTLLGSVRRLMGLGAGMAEAVGSVTAVPAGLMRRPDIGRIAVGAPADLLIVDASLELFDVFKDGVALD
jgi:N-acetylglucosamine-6-phosphate deacetylase